VTRSRLPGITGILRYALALLPLLAPALGHAQDETPTLDSGDTAWMLTATVLVLFMTIPGLALFYGGMVRSKNVLSVLMQCFAVTGLMTVLWTVYGYSLAFDTTGMVAGEINLNSFIGGFGRAFMGGVGVDSLIGTIPESVFATFQMTFAIITPALIVGAFAERMKFSSMLVFLALWFTIVYTSMTHMVWSGDGALMWDWGVLDFAGGTVVHINAGIAGLVAALVLGKRKGYPTTSMAPHNMTLHRDRCGHAVGGLVRLQCRQRGERGRLGGHGDARDPDRDRDRGARLDVLGVDVARQAERTGHRVGRGRRSRRDHPSVGHGGSHGRPR
jgi:hypothetical protein